MTKIKEQKDKITKLESEVELKVYVIGQLEKLKNENELLIKEFNRELEAKKTTIVQLNEEIESQKSTILKI